MLLELTANLRSKIVDLWYKPRKPGRFLKKQTWLTNIEFFTLSQGTKLSFGSFFVDHHFALIVELSFVPMSAVEHVWLTGSWTCRNVRSLNFVVSSAFRLACLGNLMFWMCHICMVFLLLFFFV